ncbi:beta-ketoacyl-[acyl-carrier-protein] synthase family protein [Amycolatopsis sp. NPDC006131]|uniref:beta-ketoacyl-[acyl-carrier-protein] synthase family protein n=1 Tax=Amycolatopsis sp. NPDC006131 TaxID=3156731 RepID=UPI0033B0E06E
MTQKADDNERVHITGMGFVLPGATGKDAVWRTLSAGESQIRVLPVQFANRPGTARAVGARVSDFDHHEHLPDLPGGHAKRYSREILMVLAAVEQAWSDAGLTRAGEGVDPNRIGLLGSCSRGPIEWWAGPTAAADPAYPRLDVDHAIFASLPGTPATLSAIRLGARGMVTTFSNACVGGHQALGYARDLLLAGKADVIVVVGYETPFVPEMLQLYSSPTSGVLSRAEGDPRTTIKPYDRHRDGFAFGEGAVALVLEAEESVRRRSGTAYAELGPVVSINEAAHATRMDLTGKTTADMMRRAVEEAGIPAADIGYVCGHGTATRYNDLAESRAMRLVFPDGGGRGAPPLGSIKPVFGHLLGASGVLNCAATALMLSRQQLVPTINCVDVDPECDHDHVVEGTRSVSMEHAMSLSFAIGSQSSAAVLGVAA